MGLIEKDLNQGDHIYVGRKGMLYSHHGIYSGERTVIHFRGAVREKKDPIVIKTDLENFLNGGKLKRRNYKRRLPHAETLMIAKDHLSKKGILSPSTIVNILPATSPQGLEAGGGSLGLPALAVELPVTTTIMLRSIADIARSEGGQIRLLKTKLACLEVFALGGTSKSDEGTETGYFVVRAALARTISDATKYIAEKGLVQEGAPVLVRLIAALVSRFGIIVSEKVAAQAISLIGAAGGALINCEN